MRPDLARLLNHIGDSNEAHADRDGLTGLERAVFLARGGHAPGQGCPTAEPIELHHQGCAWFMGEPCDFGCMPARTEPTSKETL